MYNIILSLKFQIFEFLFISSNVYFIKKGKNYVDLQLALNYGILVDIQTHKTYSKIKFSFKITPNIHKMENDFE